MDEKIRNSLFAVMATAVLITWNHVYSLGAAALLLGAVLLIVPAALIWWLRRTGSRWALGLYLATNAWIVVGFGFLKGLIGITLPLFAGTLLATLSTIFPRPTLGPFGYEASGLLMLTGSLFVARNAYALIRARGGSRTSSPRRGMVAIGTTAVAIALLASYAWFDADRFVVPGDRIVRIGVIVPTKGPYAVLGTSFLKAVEMAKQDLRSTKYEYQLTVVDPGTDPQKARDAIGQMVRRGEVKAIVGGISLFGQQTKPLATTARIPHLCVCTVSTIGDGAYNFTNIPSPQAEATRWVDEAKRRGITNVALLTQSYPSIINHVSALKAEARRQGLRISSEQTFDGGLTAFRRLIERARSAQPDVYYVEALEPALDALAEQFSNAGIHNLASVVAPSVSPRPELFEGVWYTDSNLRDFAFKRRFQEKYPGTQFATHMMPYAYDDFRLIVDAFEHGRNPAVYLRNLERFEGTAGTVTRAPGSGNFQSAPAVWVISNGQPALQH